MAMFRAVESFAFTGHDGVPRNIRPGDLMADDHPDFKGKERLSEPVKLAADRPGLRASAVEDASAEPNARRSLGRPRGDLEPRPILAGGAVVAGDQPAVLLVCACTSPPTAA